MKTYSSGDSGMETFKSSHNIILLWHSKATQKIQYIGIYGIIGKQDISPCFACPLASLGVLRDNYNDH